MDVSQTSSNVSKTETEEQEGDSYQCEQDQECDGDEVFAVKGMGKGSFKGTCFKCGMRGHKADRCWQKGKGKGSKGDWEKGEGGSKGKGWSKGEWSNPGHTWDSSWCNSHEHRKTYGLEVDPGSAAELVPCLCAVSLSSTCEEFSEPKRMSRGTQTKTSQSGSPRNFAQVNKLSILAPDDNEFTNNGNAVTNELMNADAVMNEPANASQPLGQNFQSPRIWHIKSERSSGFVSCGVRRR